MFKKIKARFISWVRDVFGMDKLELKDIEDRGFVFVTKQGSARRFLRDEHSLKWNTFNDTITIRKGKALRHFSVIETPRELDWALGKIFT